MNTVEVFDPALCCSTGVCGPTPDSELANFASILEKVKAQGISVARYNLAQEPLAFAQNAEVKSILETETDSALPLVFINGRLYFRGVYPTFNELEQALRPARQKSPPLTFVKVAAPQPSPSQGPCCKPTTGCC